MFTSKSDKVRELVAGGFYKRALGIAKGFRCGILKADSDKMRLAYECMIHSAFYEQIGTDTAAAISEGILILKTLYGQDNNTVD